MTPVFIVMIALFILVDAFVIILLISKQNRSRFKIFRNDVKAAQKNDAGNMNGFNYDWHYHSGSKNNPSHFRITMDCPGQGEFSIGRENSLHRLFKSLNICREIQTDDPFFDREFYIQTDMTESVSQLLYKGEIRALISDLFALGFTEVKFEKGQIIAIRTPCPSNPAQDPGFVKSALEIQARLSRECGYFFQGGIITEPPSGRAARTIFILTPILLLVAGIVSLILTVRNYRPLFEGEVFKHSLKWAIIGFNAFIVAAILALRGRSRSHKDILTAFFFSLIAFPLAGYGFLGLANARLDSGTGTPHTAVITRKYVNQSKNSKTYRVRFCTWREGRSRSLTVSRALWEGVQEGVSTVEITTRPGRFNHEWIEGWRVISHPETKQ